MHPNSEGNDRNNSELFPSLSKLSIPTSPILQSTPAKQALFQEQAQHRAMEDTEEHTSGSSHHEGGGTTGINLSWVPVPNDWDAEEKALIDSLGLGKYMETCKDKMLMWLWKPLAIIMKAPGRLRYKDITLELNAETIANAFDL